MGLSYRFDTEFNSLISEGSWIFVGLKNAIKVHFFLCFILIYANVLITGVV